MQVNFWILILYMIKSALQTPLPPIVTTAHIQQASTPLFYHGFKNTKSFSQMVSSRNFLINSLAPLGLIYLQKMQNLKMK